MPYFAGPKFVLRRLIRDARTAQGPTGLESHGFVDGVELEDVFGLQSTWARPEVVLGRTRPSSTRPAWARNHFHRAIAQLRLSAPETLGDGPIRHRQSFELGRLTRSFRDRPHDACLLGQQGGSRCNARSGLPRSAASAWARCNVLSLDCQLIESDPAVRSAGCVLAARERRRAGIQPRRKGLPASELSRSAR